ncbi:response regulator [Thiothrix fructosivorans]|uniref:Response regulator transcription factor n=1 Tax=Thiothrix fructosivorans TaxID=111770 RepID=A0A8B0SMX9_9GAMM|nr:response regulator transcription factor [Thiothrix fructosivorans]MBO0612650.1 response regulator transcription factor [Thiothrix fructosivorans]QTX11880.1 response regulator transcription factor [Thiothrix fructosivorans]
MRILIVDDHPLFREALGSLLERFYPSAAVFEVGSVEEAEGVVRQYAPFDLIMLDVFLPGQSGVAGLETLHASVAVETPIVIMSGSDNSEMMNQALAKGARGYIAKSAGVGDVKNALHLILAGEIYISPSMLAEVRQRAETKAPPTDNSGLTPRQREVMRLMAEGLPNKTIASRLHCSDGTVKLHVSAILRTLHARNRTEAVQAATRLGVL